MLSEMELGGGLLYLNVADQNKGKALNWVKRYKITIVTAEGLVYFHMNSQIRTLQRCKGQ